MNDVRPRSYFFMEVSEVVSLFSISCRRLVTCGKQSFGKFVCIIYITVGKLNSNIPSRIPPKESTSSFSRKLVSELAFSNFRSLAPVPCRRANRQNMSRFLVLLKAMRWNLSLLYSSREWWTCPGNLQEPHYECFSEGSFTVYLTEVILSSLAFGRPA